MLKRLFHIPVIILALYACGSGATLRVGEPAPGFEGTDTGGNVHRLADYRGKTVVLEWTNHDCPYVRKHYSAGNMQAQQREAAALDVVWLSVISSAPGKQGHVSHEAADELTRNRNAAPHADSITTSNPDDIPRATQYVRVALQEMAAGKPVSTPVTRPYGCSVKYR